MALEEKDCLAKLDGLTQQDWQVLRDLIPAIASTTQFGEWKGGNRADGSFIMPRCEASSIVAKFLEAVYSIPIVIDFHWGAWAERRVIR